MRTPSGMPPNIMASLESRIRQCMLADQGRFMRRLRSLAKRTQRRNGEPTGLTGLRAEIERSKRRRLARHRSMPRPSFPEELPISTRVDEIAHALGTSPVVIVCGETGSGKTTQLPKICLQAGRGAAGRAGLHILKIIGHEDSSTRREAVGAPNRAIPGRIASVNRRGPLAATGTPSPCRHTQRSPVRCW